jgi:hypothetical protein
LHYFFVQNVDLFEVIFDEVVDLLLPLRDIVIGVFNAPLIKFEDTLEILLLLKSLTIPVQKKLKMIRDSFCKVVENLPQV